MNSLNLGGMLALVFVLSVGAFVLIIWPACVLCGRISDLERDNDVRQTTADMETADHE